MKLIEKFNTILFSIIIPIYNSEKTLNNCVKSISMQKFSKLEIILINDCSSDASKKICNSLKKKHKNVKVLNNKKNIGVSASRNRGIKEAKGDFLIFLDSDDLLIKDCLKSICKIAEKNLNSDLIIAKKFVTLSMPNTFITHNVFKNINLNKKNINDPINLFIKEQQIYGNIFIFVINRKFLIKKNIYFIPNINFGEDQEFVIKILCFCNKYILYNKSFYCYSSGTGNLSNSMSFNTSLSCLKVINSLSCLMKSKSLSSVKKNYIIKIINKVLNQFIPRLIFVKKNEVCKISKYIISKKNNFDLIKSHFKGNKIFSSLKDNNYTTQDLLLYRKKVANNLLYSLRGKLKKFNHVYIFCYNYNGIAISKILKESGHNVKGFLDNNKLILNKKILGLKVKNPSVLKNKIPKYKSNLLIIISNQFAANIKSISTQLKLMGIKEKKIVY